MRRHLGLSTAIKLFYCVLLSAPGLGWSTVVITSPANYSLKPLTSDLATGYIQLELSLTPLRDDYSSCGEIEITALPQYGLKYIGDEHWQFSFDSISQYTTKLELYLPDADTSALFIRIACTLADLARTIQYYFVSTADSIEYWNSDPREFAAREKRKRIKQEGFDRDTLKESDWEEKYEIYWSMKTAQDSQIVMTTIGFIPTGKEDEPNRVTLSLRQILALINAGTGMELVNRSSWVKASTTAVTHVKEKKRSQGGTMTIFKLNKMEVQIAQKDYQEREPLKDKLIQSLPIDCEFWVRRFGETTFRKIELETDTALYLIHMRDSLNSLPENHSYDICVLVSNSVELSKVRGVVKVLPEPHDAVFYHVKLNKQQISELAGEKIRLNYIDDSLCVHLSQ